MHKLGVRFSERVNRSLFFFLAVLVHLFVFLAVLGVVVWPGSKPQPSDQPFIGITLPQPVVPPTPPTNPTPNTSTLAISPTPSLISTESTNPGVKINPTLSMPGPGMIMNDHDLATPPSNLNRPASSNPINLDAVKTMQKSWGPQGHQRFPIYLAKYADGDWNCNHYFHDGKLTSGALPNLFSKVAEWSHGEMESTEIKVIALDSPELINHPPPFVFFTGHKDFHLTDAEIANLHTYLVNGGAIWGDSAYAGDGSRFDVAFHREMKRVLPDANLNFEMLPTDSTIFTQGKFPIEDLPKGMNYRHDPIECINLDGKPAVIYTPNDYSDMMTLLLKPGRNDRDAQMDPQNHWTPDHPLFTPGNFVFHAASYYRNYDAPSAMDSYKLSMNILVYLMNRYNDELLLTP